LTVQLRLIILSSDARGARNWQLSRRQLAIAALTALGALASALWLGWKISELAARG
jgi:hypothetical protein